MSPPGNTRQEGEINRLRDRVHDLFNRVVGVEVKLGDYDKMDIGKRLRELEAEVKLSKYKLYLIGTVAGIVAAGIVEALARYG